MFCPIDAKVVQFDSLEEHLKAFLCACPINVASLSFFIWSKNLDWFKGNSETVFHVDVVFVSDMNVFYRKLYVIENPDVHIIKVTFLLLFLFGNVLLLVNEAFQEGTYKIIEVSDNHLQFLFSFVFPLFFMATDNDNQKGI